MEYIYQLHPVKKKGKPNYHEVRERFALPTWSAYEIESKILTKFKKYRIQYYPGIETSTLKFIIKIGVSNNPSNRVRAINNNWKSGRTEYLEVGVITYVRILLYMVRLWVFSTIIIPAVFLAFIILLIIFL